MTHTYKYPRPALTVDAAVFAKEGDDWYVLTITRGKEPFKGRRAFPGGFFDLKDESTLDAAVRELREETGCKGEMDWKLVGVFDRKDRDPRERVISTAYTTVIPERKLVKGADDAASAKWERISEVAGAGSWAFDHYEILVRALGAHGYGSPKHV